MCVEYSLLKEFIPDASLSAGHGSSRFMEFLHIMS